jgi:hypothetical protein
MHALKTQMRDLKKKQASEPCLSEGRLAQEAGLTNHAEDQKVPKTGQILRKY